MLDVPFIVKTPQLRQSQNFAFLRAEGVSQIEKLAHRLWTDYNVHDPGITLLEYLCYAITDLGHRTAYDIKDLLTKNVQGLPANLSNFHTAREVLTCAPVTFDDLRKLLIDIHGVRNAWIEKHDSVVYYLDSKNQKLIDDPGSLKFVENNPPLNGLYDVFIEYEEFVKPLHVGLQDNMQGNGSFIEPDEQGLQFHVAHAMTLQTVSLYADRPGELFVELRDQDNNTLCTIPVLVTRRGEKFRVLLDVSIQPGENYCLVVKTADTSGIKLYHSTEPSFPYSIDDLVYLISGVKGEETQEPYYFLYDWEILCVVPPPSRCPSELLTTSTGLSDNSGAGGFIDTLDKGINFVAYRDLLLDAVTVYPETAGSVTIRLMNIEEGLEIDSRSLAVEDGPESVTVPLGFKLRPGKMYRLDAQGTTVKLFRNTGMTYPVGQDTILSLLSGFPSEQTHYFFYNWVVSYPAYPQPYDVTPGQIRWSVNQTLHEHRNLCEDFVNICDLEIEEIAVCTDLEVVPSVEVEAVLAEIFYRLGQDIAPRVTFYTIDELLAKGRTTDQIFEGPKLEHGFIDDEEFQAITRKCEIRVSDIMQTILNVPGVLAIKQISLLSFVQGNLRAQEDWILGLTTDRFRAPELSTARSKVIFYKNNLPYYPNRNRVEDLLKEKKSADIQGKLKGHDKDLPIPVGEDRELETYYPIQNELPANYRVGKLRAAESDSSIRKAQSRQLKAYLLLYEQILANFLSQLANVRLLFSWEVEAVETYFTQAVTNIADLEDLFYHADLAAAIRECDPTHPALPEFSLPVMTEEEQLRHFATQLLPAALRCIIEDKETAYDRRGRFLDHMLARFSETFVDYRLLMFNILKDSAAERVLEDQRVFLEEYPLISSRRGTAYDYRFPDEPENLSGYQYRLYRLLGIPVLDRRHLAGHRFSIEQGTFLDPCWDPDQDSDVEETREGWRFVLTNEDGDILFRSCVCESRSAIEMILDFALSIGGEVGNYQEKEEGDGFLLMRRCRDDSKDEPIGITTSVNPSDLEEVRQYFEQHGEAEGCHVVEHLLLRKRFTKDPFMDVQLRDPQDCDCVEVRDPYSFRMTIVLSSWPRRFRDLKFRAFVEETIRRETPAHIFPKICWISHEQMKEFEQNYHQWSTQLAALTDRLGGCRSTITMEKFYPLSGQLPLSETQEDDPYSPSLQSLIETMQKLVTVYPLARLHDCKEASGDTPQVTLNHTNLGTF